MEKKCENCYWWEHEDIDDGHIYVNADSDMVADWTESDYSCEQFTRKDGGT